MVPPKSRMASNVLSSESPVRDSCVRPGICERVRVRSLSYPFVLSSVPFPAARPSDPRHNHTFSRSELQEEQPARARASPSGGERPRRASQEPSSTANVVRRSPSRHSFATCPSQSDTAMALPREPTNHCLYGRERRRRLRGELLQPALRGRGACLVVRRRDPPSLPLSPRPRGDAGVSATQATTWPFGTSHVPLRCHGIVCCRQPSLGDQRSGSSAGARRSGGSESTGWRVGQSHEPVATAAARPAQKTTLTMVLSLASHCRPSAP